MALLSAKLLEQLHQIAQEVPASTLDAVMRVLMTVSFGDLSTLKHRLLPLLPRASWRQLTSDLVDVWQTEATLLGGNAIATALATAAHCQNRLHQELSAELVWTGSNPEALPLRRTDQTLLQLIRDAQQDLLIISFAIYDIPEIVQALIGAIDRGVNVRIIAEIPEASTGKISFGMAATFGAAILERSQVYVWHKEKRPVDEQGRYGSLHAKCTVCDQQHLFISSANLTAYAMSLNIEMGVLIHNRTLAVQVMQQINSLILHGDLAYWENDS